MADQLVLLFSGVERTSWIAKNLYVMAEPLCYAPFIHMRASSFGYSPCCVYTEPQSAESPEAYWNSLHIQTTRKQLLDGVFPSGCSLCKYNKEKGVRTEAEHYNYLFSQSKTIVDVKKGNSREVPFALEYKPSNKCNLMCRMCRPSDSDLIEKEAKKYNLINRYNDVSYPKTNIDSVEKYALTNNIEKIYVLGGETALNPNAIAFLEKLDGNKFIQSTTNATTLNKKYMSVLKKLHLIISIDGVDKTYEYIRTNAKWHITEKNVRHILNYESPKSIRFNYVMTPYNIFNLVDSLLWFDNLEDTTKKPFGVFFSDSDDYATKLNAIKTEDVEYVLDQLYTSSVRKTKRLYDVIDLLLQHNHDDKLLTKFIEFNNKIDKIRQTQLLSLNQRFINYV